MGNDTTQTERDYHRKFAVDLFNFVWTLLDKPERTAEENDLMLHAAHASRYHWGEAGMAVNLTRGEWLVSRVYAVLKRPEPALYHARRCLEICQQNGIGDFDLAFAYEALARASAIAGQHAEREQYLALAREAAEHIAEQDDKDLLLSDLATMPG
ncbi:MAG TPA: hypothetical protein VIK33_10140 [Anaerolineae bacterium]